MIESLRNNQGRRVLGGGEFGEDQPDGSKRKKSKAKSKYKNL